MILIKIRELVDEDGKSLYREWLEELDLTIRARVQARIFRIESGNLGDYKFVGNGVWELRLNFGAGYRVYYGMEGKNLIILLTGGDKHSQYKDISKAQELWMEYMKRDKNGKKK